MFKTLLAWFVPPWLAWAGLLAAAMVLGNFSEEGHGVLRATTARMGSSIVLVLAAWLAYGLWRNLAGGRFAWCLAVGMTLGAVGDFFNAGLLDFVPLSNPVLGGIVAFGLGHIAYIVGCVELAKRAGLTDWCAIGLAVLAWQGVALVSWYFVVAQGSEARALVWPALPYSLLLAGTAGIGGGLALQNRQLLVLALGGALFLISDLILAFGMFRGHFAHQTEWVWLTYGPGQMLIVFSVPGAAAMLNRAPKQ